MKVSLALKSSPNTITGVIILYFSYLSIVEAAYNETGSLSFQISDPVLPEHARKRRNHSPRLDKAPSGRINRNSDEDIL